MEGAGVEGVGACVYKSDAAEVPQRDPGPASFCTQCPSARTRERAPAPGIRASTLKHKRPASAVARAPLPALMLPPTPPTPLTAPAVSSPGEASRLASLRRALEGGLDRLQGLMFDDDDAEVPGVRTTMEDALDAATHSADRTAHGLREGLEDGLDAVSGQTANSIQDRLEETMDRASQDLADALPTAEDLHQALDGKLAGAVENAQRFAFRDYEVPKEAAPEEKQAAPEEKEAAPEEKQAAPEEKQAAPEEKQAAPERSRRRPRRGRCPTSLTSPTCPTTCPRRATQAQTPRRRHPLACPTTPRGPRSSSSQIRSRRVGRTRAAPSTPTPSRYGRAVTTTRRR